MKSDFDLIEKELSYKIQGVFLKVGKEFGRYYKEEVYQRAIEEELEEIDLKFISKPKIPIYSKRNRRKIGEFVPDLIIEDKIIIEIKVVKCLLESSISQLISYLEKSNYEVGYLVNFGTSYIQIIRRVYSNNRKRRELIANYR